MQLAVRAYYVCVRGVISTFSWGGNFFLNISMPPDYWKIGKKQHFICSNLTLFIVPFFLFSSFFLFFLFFLFFFFLFSFFFFLGGGGATAPQPPSNDISGMRPAAAAVTDLHGVTSVLPRLHRGNRGDPLQFLVAGIEDGRLCCLGPSCTEATPTIFNSSL